MSKKEEKEEKEEKKSSAKKEDLKTLLELVQIYSDIGDFQIFMNLSKHGYMEKYYEEQKRQKLGFEIEPIMTENEFKKIIGV